MRHVFGLLLRFLLIGSLGFGVGLVVPLYRNSRNRDLSKYPPDDRRFIETFQLMTQLKWADERVQLNLADKLKSSDQRRRVIQEALQSIAEGEALAHTPDLASLFNAQAGIMNLRGFVFEEGDGNSQAVSSHLEKAQNYLKAAGWRDCSEVHLRSIMQQPGVSPAKHPPQ